ncbi:MAG: hypothetical protein Q8900_03510 [Bacillota bacterium]|nr:hypothetical protein [Bacillota bacterium]
MSTEQKNERDSESSEKDYEGYKCKKACPYMQKPMMYNFCPMIPQHYNYYENEESHSEDNYSDDCHSEKFHSEESHDHERTLEDESDGFRAMRPFPYYGPHYMPHYMPYPYYHHHYYHHRPHFYPMPMPYRSDNDNEDFENDEEGYRPIHGGGFHKGFHGGGHHYDYYGKGHYGHFYPIYPYFPSYYPYYNDFYDGYSE